MATRRHNGAGSIRKRPDGRWEGRLRYQDPETGEEKRVSVYGASSRSVREQLNEAVDRLAEGAPVKDARVTVSNWSRQWAATTLEASSRRESTKSLYRGLIAKHIVQTKLGSVTLDQLRPSHIDGWILELRARTRTVTRMGGKVETVRALADSTITRTYQTLQVVLRDAVRDGLIARSPMELTRQPRFDRHEARYLSVEETVRILDAARGTRFWTLFALIAATGLRKGEASALRWSDVDFDSGTIVVRGTLSRIDGKLVVTAPKTRTSRRNLTPAPGVLKVLTEQHRLQEMDRHRAGNLWREQDFVFTTDTGMPFDPRNVLRALQTAATKAGLADVTVHTLRHSAATAMLEQGVNLKAVSELLGHAGIQITANTYGHVSTETARRAMNELGRSLGF